MMKKKQTKTKKRVSRATTQRHALTPEQIAKKRINEWVDKVNQVVIILVIFTVSGVILGVFGLFWLALW